MTRRNFSIFIAEHLLSIISTAYYSIACAPVKIEPFEDYFRMELNQLFVYFEYSPYLAFAGKCLNVMSTFLWTYMDLFVMIVSIGLSAQFRKINRHLMKHKGQVSETSQVSSRKDTKLYLLGDARKLLDRNSLKLS